MNRLKVVAPITIKGWLERQTEPIEITLFQGFDATEWVIVPPFEIQAQDDWTDMLYRNMFMRFEGLRSQEKSKEKLIVEWRWFNEPDYEDTHDIEAIDEREVEYYDEPETTILIGHNN